MKRILAVLLCLTFVGTMIPSFAMPMDLDNYDPATWEEEMAQRLLSFTEDEEDEERTLMAAITSTATGQYCIDVPSSANGNQFNRMIKLRGWVQDNNDIVKVEYQFDNAQTRIQGTQESRSDVAKAHPGYPTGHEGFSDEIDARDFMPGSHTVKFYFTTGNGTVYNATASFTVNAYPVLVNSFTLHGHQYRVYDGAIRYSDAKTWATDNKEFLVTVYSQEILDRLAHAVQRGERAAYWVGAEKINNVLTWADTGVPVSSRIADTTGSYVMLNAAAGTLTAASNNDMGSDVGFITERIDLEASNTVTYGMNIYTIYDDVYPYSQAKTFAEDMGGALATFSSEAERMAVAKALGSMDGYWIGTTNTRLLPDGTTQTATDPNFTGFICKTSGDVSFGAGVKANNDHTYYRVDSGMTWDAARAACELHGGRLAVIPNVAIQNAVKGLFASNPKARYWVGANDRDEEGVYRWIDGSSGFASDLLFEDGEPNDYVKNEDYILMYGNNGKLNDASQASPHRDESIVDTGYGFVIEYYDEPIPAKVDFFKDHVYARFDTKVWNDEAKSRANALNGKPVQVDSAEEASFLIELMQGGASAYWAEGDKKTVSAAYGKAGSQNDMEKYGYIVEFSMDFAAKMQTVYNGHRYLAFDAGLPYYVAESFSNMLGGHLASVADAGENAALAQMIQNGDSYGYWIGADNTSGSYRWTDGTAFDYTNWDSQQPDNGEGGEYFAEMKKTNGKWNDLSPKPARENPLYRHGFIAEVEENKGILATDLLVGSDRGAGRAVATLCNVRNTAFSGTVIFGIFDRFDRMIGASSKSVSIDPYRVGVLEADQAVDNAVKAGIYFWDRVAGLRPLATEEVKTIENLWEREVPDDVAKDLDDGIYMLRNKATGEYLTFAENVPAQGTALATSTIRSKIFNLFKFTAQQDGGMSMRPMASDLGGGLNVSHNMTLGGSALFYPVETEDGYYYLALDEHIETVIGADVTAAEYTGEDLQKWELVSVTLTPTEMATIKDNVAIYQGAGESYTKVATVAESDTALLKYSNMVGGWYYVSYTASPEATPVYGFVNKNDVEYRGSNGSTMSYSEAKAMHNRYGTGSILTRGVDISEWQTTPNFTAMKNGGYTYVILRAGYTGSSSGSPVKDPTFETKYAAAKAAGMDIGAYYYTRCLNNSQAQAEVNGFVGFLAGKQFSYPLYMDLEEQSQMRSGIGDVATAFCSYLENKGYFAGVYANLNAFTYYIGGGPGANYEYWIAHYLNTPSDMRYANTYGMWQYAGDGSGGAPGYTAGDIDKNVCYKDYPNMIKALGMNGF